MMSDYACSGITGHAQGCDRASCQRAYDRRTVGVKNLRTEIAMTADDTDVYGWAIGWQFSIADVLAIRDHEVPAAWEYRPGLMVMNGEEDELAESTYEASILMDMLDAQEITPGAMRYWGTVLARYIDLCRLAGRDY